MLEVATILLIGFGVPVAIMGLTLRFAYPAPRWEFGVQLMSVAVIPLVALCLYLFWEYRTWRWSAFPYGSLIPHAIAAALFLAGLGVILYRSSAPLYAKVIVGLVALVGWIALWFFSSLVTSCAMGDCL